jgi:hypothetical protein
MSSTTRVLSHSSLAFSLLLVLAFAVPTQAALVYALTDENDLLSFDSSAPEDLLGNSVISGLAQNEDLVGIDFRPATNQLYGVGSFGAIYTINPATGLATAVAQLNVALSGSRFGVDFNPVADRLRIVSDLDQSLRVNVASGAATVDGNLSYGGTPNPNVTAVAYTNSVSPTPASTSLYGIDVRSTGDQLVLINPPNSGTLTAVGPLGVDVASLNGFDILSQGATNTGYAALQRTVNGVSEFFTINLTTGAAGLVGVIGGGDLIDGIAVVIPEPATFSMVAMALTAGALARRRRR